MADSFYELYCEEVRKNEILVKENTNLKIQVRSLTSRVRYLEENEDKIIERKVEAKVKAEVDKVTEAFKDKVISLEKTVDHLRSVLNNDSTNSGIPTSKTSISKAKHIPNSRETSGKAVGGQKNHPKHKLERFHDDEVTDYVDHKTDTCPVCHTPMVINGEGTIKDEYDFRIVVKKIRHRFYETVCPVCHHMERVNIPAHLKEENQYGYGVQNLALTLVNEGFVSMHRTKEIIIGLTGGEIDLSEGYISKLQKRLSDNLVPFITDLKKHILNLNILHWDDTVIFINKKNACLRFYGNEELAFYTAHEQKNKEGVDEDNILPLLRSDQMVVHDHNKVNYNSDYEFQNVECCVHLLRDLKKVVDNLDHEWPKNLIELLLRENHNRNIGNYVDAGYISLIYDQYVAEGYYENLNDRNRYYGDTEETLLKRLEKYKENYLMWTLNEEIPFSNNVSERSLRSSKTKMKVSGQFINLKNAEYYANIRSYLETGHRHGVNSSELIERALKGDPILVEEMKEHDKSEE